MRRLEQIEKARENIRRRQRHGTLEVLRDTINVAFGIDDGYAVHCATAVASLLDFLPQKQAIRIFILNSNLSPANQERMAALFGTVEGLEMSCVHVDAAYFESFSHRTSYISTATYFRLKLQELLPSELEKVLYLDSDLVVTDNISKLWAMDLGDHYIGAIPDAQGKAHAARLGFPAGQPYVNAGVSMFNLRKLRRIDADKLYLDTHNEFYDQITLQDQDIINIAFAGSVALLPLRWNVQAPFYNPPDYYEADEILGRDDAAAADPGIVHFTGRSKPWQAACTHPLRSVYLRYRRRIGWELDRKKYYKSALFSLVPEGRVLILHICFIKLVIKKKYVRWLYNLLGRGRKEK